MGIENFKQYNYDATYSGGSFASQACGPTSCANLLGISPLTTADWLTQNGYAVTGHGTDWSGIPACLSAYGGGGKQLNYSSQYGSSGTEAEQLFKTHIANGYCGILLMGGPSYWTGSGHYISIVGYQNGQYLVHDPASTARDGYHSWGDFQGLVKVYYTSTISHGGTPEPVVADGKTFTVESISKGSTGLSVLLAQELLSGNGYKLKIDKDFGDETLAAVKKFQKAKGLEVDGCIGQNTWRALLPNIACVYPTFTFLPVYEGSGHTDSCRILQTILWSLQYTGADGKALTIDGDCGANTTYAIKSYQKKVNELGGSLNIDGSCGPATWTAIFGR